MNRARRKSPRSVRLLATIAATAIVVGSTFAQAQSPSHSLEQVFAQANGAYFANDFPNAIRGYEALVEAGVEDADVYYNLGCAHGRADHLGFALLFFERALAVEPGHEGALANLAEVEARLARRAPEGAAVQAARSASVAGALVRPFSSDTLAVLVLLLEFGLFASLAALHLARRETLRIALGITAPVLAVGFLAATCGLLIKLEVFETGRAAIVVGRDAPILEGPDPRATQRGSLQEGQAIRLIDAASGYALVQTGDGRRVWTPTAGIGTVRRGS